MRGLPAFLAGRPAYSEAFDPRSLRTFPRPESLRGATPHWAYGGSTGAGIKVAVIDSGVDSRHPAVGEVAGYLAIGRAGDPLACDASPHRDDSGHGTACAGIIRAIAPACELYSVKVLGPRLRGSGVALIVAVQWAIAAGMHVCNLSLGTTRTAFFVPLREMASRAEDAGTVLIAAANNRRQISYPSMCPHTIAVASHAVPDPLHILHDPGSPVEFGARGIGVRVPWRDGRWITASGNSLAAPHVSGVIARILAKHPELTPSEVRGVLGAIAANAAPAPVPRT